MILEVQNLDFSYEKKTPILENVTLAVTAGEFVGLFGPNGGGKTTLLQLLMGFLKPSKGKIRIANKTPKAARPLIGYVPQVTSYDRQFPLSVLELVLMGILSENSWWGGLPKNGKERAEEALRKVNLLDKKNAPFSTLSGGQAQRALIARALVSNPALLLLDEPTASVDTKAEQEIHDLLLSLKGTTTILMVTHDLQTVFQKVDRWLCINRQVTSYLPNEMCLHFSHGLYHHPSSLPII